MFKAKILGACFIVIMAFSFLLGCNDSQNLSIKKRAGKDFVVLQFADMQIKDFESVQPQLANLKNIVLNESPDLVVLTGDNTQGKNSLETAQKLVNYLDTLNVKYAATFGNHDSEYCERQELADVYLKGKNCIFRTSPSEEIQGVTNYIIEIKEKRKTVHTIFLFDSNSYRDYTDEEINDSALGGRWNYDYIYPSQIDWYEQQVLAINKKARRNVPSTAFFHIPLPEFRLAKNSSDYVGTIGEDSSTPYINTGLFDKMALLGSTKGVFVGHDHLNNYSFVYKGIRLGYGMKTLATSYHSEARLGVTKYTFINKMTEYKCEMLFMS